MLTMRYFFILWLLLTYTITGYGQNTLTDEEKLFGLSTLWQEVNYNFAFFNQVPDLNWDNEYKKAIHDVLQSDSDLAYYKVLQTLTAKLQDGHTQVYLPTSLSKKFSTLKIKVKQENGAYYIVDFAKELSNQLILGAEIMSVNNISTPKYIHNKVAPTIAASTTQGKIKLIEDYFFYGMKDELVEIEMNKDGISKKVSLIRNYANYNDWKLNSDEILKDFAYRKQGDIAVVELNSFEQKDIIKKFEHKINEINKSKGLIIDLRHNTGGLGIVGLNIAKHLVQSNQIVDLAWKSKFHVASHKAWGNSGLQIMGYDKVEAYSDFGDLKEWIEITPDTIQLKADRKKINVPIKILIGPSTASSAENFLAFLVNEKNIETYGSSTFGSTGQPIYFSLPGNGYARVCAKRNYFPDGTEFVGYGITPIFAVKNTVNDLIQKRDKVFLKAFNNF